MLIVSLKIGKRVQKENEKRKVKLDKLTSSSYDYIGGIKEIKSFNIFDKIYPSVRKRREEYLNAASQKAEALQGYLDLIEG